mmetsp:Transcript_15168/g.33911  ORF Transcript_15168/g.33911 Transcript_15168/m.33911 type:complete len:255 (-) Transcript_15168:896-1660(-)
MNPSFHFVFVPFFSIRVKSTVLAITARYVFISASASPYPRQKRNPAPNGKYSLGVVSAFSQRSGLNPFTGSIWDSSSVQVTGSKACVRPMPYQATQFLGICVPSMVTVWSTVRTPPPETDKILMDSLMTASRYGHSWSIIFLVSSEPCADITLFCSSTSFSHTRLFLPIMYMILVRVLDDVSDPATKSKRQLSIICFLVSLLALWESLETSASTIFSLSSMANTIPLNVDSSGPFCSNCSIFLWIRSVRYTLAR